ncbi:MAG: hypothetical protein GEU73_17210 [Chloroflexi bacterium]|nr:hypothetical protein [Chloroflexota bacterium]
MVMRPYLPLACALLFAALAAEAHHSIAGAYDSRRTVRVEGLVVRFAFVNPHAFVTLEVRESGRAPQVWHLEMDDRGELSEIGMTEETLKPGDRLVVSGSPGRREANRMYIQRLHRPADGYGYEQVNSRPRLRSADR